MENKTKNFIIKSNLKHNNFYDYSKVNFINSKIKIIIICPEHGEFEQRPDMHLNGQGCKKCALKKLSQLKINESSINFIVESNKIHNNFYQYPEEYKGSNINIKIICPKHGEFYQLPSNHLKGCGCPKCSNELKSNNYIKSNNQWLIEVNLKHNNFYQYPEEYNGSINKIKIICPLHGEFYQKASHHLSGQGCPKCASELKSKLFLKTNEQFINESLLKHNNFYDYSKTEYIYSEEKVIITCPNHGDFSQTAYQHLQGHGCPLCNNGISKAELEIIDYLKYIGINNIEQSNRKILNGLEIDIYLPDYNLAIEYNGNYWHSDEFKENNHHVQKTNECLNKGIQLIHIFEDEWLLKKEIVKSRLLNLLNKIPSDHKIYARNCFIKEISSEEAKKFTERNHLQGFVGAKIHLGLFTIINNKEYMVSYMSFGSLRKNLGQINNNQYSFELLRFCSVITYSVIGGANKLLKYFEKNYNPNYLISYADRRWSQGKIYEKLNFVQSHISKPNYFYINPQTPLKRENRFNYRKDILISKYGCKPEYTENYFTTQILGLKKIYDSGNLVFIKEYK